MILTVDPASSVPLFRQLAASVRSGLASGAIVAGERLPAAREVAASLQVNVHTVLHAYAELRDEGLIELRRGRGATVTEAAVDRAALLGALDDLVAAARHLGLDGGDVTAMVRQRFDTDRPNPDPRTPDPRTPDPLTPDRRAPDHEHDHR